MGGMKMKLVEQRLAEQKIAELKAAQAREVCPIQEDILEEEDEEEEESMSESDYDDIELDPEPTLSPLKQAARRGWQIIRRNIQEVAMERKKKKSFNWSFLRQHIANMTDTEKARNDLYEKYIYKPSNWWTEGFVKFPSYLFEKTQPGRVARRHPSRAQSAVMTSKRNNATVTWRPSTAISHSQSRTRSGTTVGWR